MKKIVVVSVSPTDATSWYRAMGVLFYLEKYGYEFTPYKESWMDFGGNSKGFGWPQVKKYDAIYIQRGFDKMTIELVNYMKLGRKKVVYELDDNLWEIPSYFKIKEFYPKERLDSIVSIMRLSDLVIVSTQHLADYIQDNFQIECKVVNNALDTRIFPIQDFNEEGPTVWRGSNTHVDDLRKFRDEMERYEGLISFGHDPVKDRPLLNLKNYKYQKPLDPFVYFHTLRDLKPQKVLVPLEENTFNASKSNIAWLEATMAGAVVFSNQWGEFKGIGFKFGDKPSIDEMRAEHQRSRELIEERYGLDYLNGIRRDLLDVCLQNHHQ